MERGTVSETRRRPVLTARVLDGLVELAAYGRAGSPADIGIDEKTAEGREAWANVVRASEWVAAMQRYRKTEAK